MRIRNQDQDLTIMNADASKLTAVPAYAPSGLYIGHNVHYLANSGNMLMGTYDDDVEANRAILAVSVLGKYLPSVTMSGHSNTDILHYAGW